MQVPCMHAQPRQAPEVPQQRPQRLHRQRPASASVRRATFHTMTTAARRTKVVPLQLVRQTGLCLRVWRQQCRFGLCSHADVAPHRHQPLQHACVPEPEPLKVLPVSKASACPRV